MLRTIEVLGRRCFDSAIELLWISTLRETEAYAGKRLIFVHFFIYVVLKGRYHFLVQSMHVLS